jgi:hypothetical protein
MDQTVCPDLVNPNSEKSICDAARRDSLGVPRDLLNFAKESLMDYGELRQRLSRSIWASI